MASGKTRCKPYTFNAAPFIPDKDFDPAGLRDLRAVRSRAEGGFTPNVFLLADYGYDSYSTLIETRRDLIEKKPDLVQRFVDASIIGWMNYIYGDNAKANALIKARQPGHQPRSSRLFGRQDAAAWHRRFRGRANAWRRGDDAGARQELLRQDGGRRSLQTRSRLSAAYTLQFVDKSVGLDLRPRPMSLSATARHAENERPQRAGFAAWRRQDLRQRRRGAERPRSRHPRRRIPDAARPLGLRQIDDFAPHRGT